MTTTTFPRAQADVYNCCLCAVRCLFNGPKPQIYSVYNKKPQIYK